MQAGPPQAEIQVPAPVAEVAGRRPLRAVWESEVGGLTFEVGTRDERCFVKWVPASSGIDLSAEVTRLGWAAAFTAVPAVLDHGSDGTGTWMVTAALPGENAVTDRWRADPARAVAAIGQGLRALHDALPVDACPFSWSVEQRRAGAGRRAASGDLDPARWHRVHQPLGMERALEALAEAPPIDLLVVCHGDSCAPNTLIAEDGRCSGHVDLGALGVADRWADLAVATWSTEWNYGPGFEAGLLAAYGIAPDPERIRYYRLLWDLGP